MARKDVSNERRRLTLKTLSGVLMLLLILSIPLSMIIWQLYERARFSNVVARQVRISKPMIALIRVQAEIRGMGYGFLVNPRDDTRLLQEMKAKKGQMSRMESTLHDIINHDRIIIPEREFARWKSATDRWEKMYEKLLSREITEEIWIKAANHGISTGKQIISRMLLPYTSDELIELLAVLKLEALDAADLIGIERALIGRLLRLETTSERDYLQLHEQHGMTLGSIRPLTQTLRIEFLPQPVREAVMAFRTEYLTVYGSLRDDIMAERGTGNLSAVRFGTWWENATAVVNKALHIAETADTAIGEIGRKTKDRVRRQLVAAILSSVTAIGLFFLLLNWLLTSLNRRIQNLHDTRQALSEHKTVLEKTVRERTSALQMVIDAAVDAIIVINEKGMILEFNHAAEKMFGYPAGDLIGKNVKLLMPAPHRSRHDSYIRRYVETGKQGIVGRSRETTALKKDGTEFPIRISVGNANIKGSTRFAAFIEDITERKQSEQALKDSREQALLAVKARSMFLANMSHEIRTPMNSILGFIKIVLENPGLPHNAVRHLEIANDSARGLLRIINDILDMSKLDQGHVNLEKIPLNLPHVVKESIATLQPVSRRNGNTVEFHYDGRLPHCFLGDPVRLKQVFVNLAGNALKFTRNGRVVVEVNPVSDRQGLCIRVKDRGPGIPADKIDHIFEQFSQADQSISRRFGGTGLGLTISRQLIRAMGGDIRISSKEGRGTTVTVLVDLPHSECVESCEINSHTVEAPEKISPRAFNILLAEDVAQNAMLAKIRLEEQRHDVKVVENGRNAVDEFKKQSFDVVLMDIHMPEMDGLKATRMIREIENGSEQRTPVIALTASILPEDIDQCRAAGIDVVLPKPIDFNRLFAAMEDVVPPSQGKSLSSVDVILEEEIPDRLAGVESVVNVKTALERWGHHESILLDNLKTFASNHGRSGKKVRAAVAAKAFQQAFEISHKLKGVSGNLGIEMVERITEKICTLLKTGEISDESVYKALCRLADDLTATLKKVAAVLSGLEPAGPVTDFTAAPDDTGGETMQQLIRLDTMLAKAEIDEHLVGRIGDGFEQTVYQPDFSVIRKLIDEFDFEQAREQLIRLRKRLPAGKGCTVDR